MLHAQTEDRPAHGVGDSSAERIVIASGDADLLQEFGIPEHRAEIHSQHHLAVALLDLDVEIVVFVELCTQCVREQDEPLPRESGSPQLNDKREIHVLQLRERGDECRSHLATLPFRRGRRELGQLVERIEQRPDRDHGQETPHSRLGMTTVV